jgi:hypothetical protein
MTWFLVAFNPTILYAKSWGARFFFSGFILFLGGIFICLVEISPFSKSQNFWQKVIGFLDEKLWVRGLIILM